MTFSLVVPLYRNEESIPDLIETIESLDRKMAGELEAVMVVDGSPDRCLEILRERLPHARFRSQLISLSRNFGSFAAIGTGLEHGRGEMFATMSADLQDPPELILEFRERLMEGRCDVVVGRRLDRSDPLSSRVFSSLYWGCYRTLVLREVPRGGIDVFGCTRAVRDQLITLEESNSSVVGLLIWLGFRRSEVSYSRRPRRHGRSAWSFGSKLRYMLDSTFAFSDLPIKLLSLVGGLGLMFSLVLAALVLVAKFTGTITIPGYTATVLTVIFFGGLNSLGLGLIGEYVWRAFENTKGRPNAVVAFKDEYGSASKRR